MFYLSAYFLSGQIQSPSLTRKLFPDILVPISLAVKIVRQPCHFRTHDESRACAAASAVLETK